jgi:hypothetical protein
MQIPKADRKPKNKWKNKKETNLLQEIFTLTSNGAKNGAHRKRGKL